MKVVLYSRMNAILLYPKCLRLGLIPNVRIFGTCKWLVVGTSAVF